MEKRTIVLFVTMVVLFATLTQMSTDLYTPSLPAIAHFFNTTMGQSQLTMSYFIFGVSLTTLVYGPISEGIGRRNTIIIGILIAFLGTLLCRFSSGIHMMQYGRLIQGCGLGSCSALWRSVFRDRLSGKEASSYMSIIVNMIVLTVILSPVLGGQLQVHFGWQANFNFLLFWMGFVLLMLVLFFKETSEHHGMDRLNLRFLISSYGELLRHRRFMGFTLMSFLVYGGLFAWLTAGPVILIKGLGVSPAHFGYLMILCGLSTGASSYVNKLLVKHWPSDKVMLFAMALMFLSGVAMIVSVLCWGVNVFAIIIPVMVFILGSTIIFIGCFVEGFETVGHIAGYAGSLYAAIQQFGGLVSSATLGHLDTHSPMPMALMFIFSGVAVFLVYRLVAAKRPE